MDSYSPDYHIIHMCNGALSCANGPLHKPFRLLCTPKGPESSEAVTCAHAAIKG